MILEKLSNKGDPEKNMRTSTWKGKIDRLLGKIQIPFKNFFSFSWNWRFLKNSIMMPLLTISWWKQWGISSYCVNLTQAPQNTATVLGSAVSLSVCNHFTVSFGTLWNKDSCLCKCWHMSFPLLYIWWIKLLYLKLPPLLYFKWYFWVSVITFHSF